MERFDFGSSDAAEAVATAAAAALARDGVCVLDGVVDPELVDSLRSEFEDEYAAHLSESGRDGALTVGDRRFMLTTALAGAFGSPAVYANDAVLAVVRATLAPDCVLDNFGVVASLPGSTQQHIHRDGGALFPLQVAGLLPAHAVTAVIPLVDMNELSGTTAVLPGTHRYRGDETSPRELPMVPVGSCVLWDYRLLHGGTPNVSDRLRPIVYMTYARKWWRDVDNYRPDGQPRLALPMGFRDSLPAHLRPLFAHV